MIERNDKRVVEIWLSKKEKQETNLQGYLKQLYQAYAEQNFTVAVFYSGERDLAQGMSGLLVYNKRLGIQKEHEQEII